MNYLTPRLQQAMLLLLVGLTLMSCGTLTSVQTTIPTYPSHPLTPTPEKVVVANAFDVKSKSYRDSKEAEFNLLLEAAVQRATDQVQSHSEAEAEGVKGISIANRESSMQELLHSSHATHGIFITSFNAYFDQTHVEVTKTENGKDREAFYDIVVEMKYSLRGIDGLSLDTLVSVRKFHSSRSVLSGLLAAGPSIVSNHNDALEGVYVNVDQYLKSFFPGEENRIRRLMLSKDFKAIGEAIRHSNYAGAFEASQRLTNSPDKKTSATAFYVCAVLAERNSDFQNVKGYLEESLKRQHTFNAQAMLDDYRFQP